MNLIFKTINWTMGIYLISAIPMAYFPKSGLGRAIWFFWQNNLSLAAFLGFFFTAYIILGFFLSTIFYRKSHY